MIHLHRTLVLAAALAGVTTGRSMAQIAHPVPAPPPKNSSQQELPDAPAKTTVQKVCGTCHSANIVLGRGHTREEWSEVVAGMISRGAKGTQGEFTEVIDYLSRNLPPKVAAGAKPTSRRRGGGGGLTVGPDDKQIVDEDAADRGRAIYTSGCVSCHGPKARGTDRGEDLVRSLVVIHDRYGSTLGPFLHEGHPRENSAMSKAFTPVQIGELSHFLHQQLNDTLRSGPYSKVLNVLTGDPKAGEAYFRGAGKCGECHSATGDLAGIASKYDAPTLQQRLLFPHNIGFHSGGIRVAKPVTVTVTPENGPAISGTLEKIDDFNVSLLDASGQYHSWKRSPGLKVEKNDPYAAHNELLDRYTDKDMHDVVAYLATLK